jgi:hypothetical protein
LFSPHPLRHLLLRHPRLLARDLELDAERERLVSPIETVRELGILGLPLRDETFQVAHGCCPFLLK